MRSINSLSLVLPLGMIAACSEPGHEDYDAVASAVAPLLAEGPGSEAEAIRECSGAAHGTVPDDFRYDDDGGMHGRRGKLEYHFRLTCRTREDQVQERCNAETAFAELELFWYGDVHTARHEASLDRAVDWTISDLDRDFAVLSGTGNFHVESMFNSMDDGLMKSWVLDIMSEYRVIQLRTEDHAILSGEVAYEIDAKRAVSGDYRNIERELDMSVLVTFDGAGGARMVFDGERKYDVDLHTSRIVYVP